MSDPPLDALPSAGKQKPRHANLGVPTRLLRNASMSEEVQPDRFRYPITKRERRDAAIRAAVAISNQLGSG